MKAALLATPKFKDLAEVKRILEVRGWSLVKTKPDYVITVGGDGSILYAESKYPGIPIIALNAGELGFLACNEVDNLEEVLDSVEKSKIVVEKRRKLEFTAGKEKGVALNEVLVTSSVAGKALRLNIEVGGTPLGFFVCDGVLVSTPTGSTGYNLSCGGPIIEPGNGVMALTLISPHLSRLKSMVLSSGQKIAISFARENPGITVVADGLGSVRISHKEKVVIKGSKRTAKLVTRSPAYFSRLERFFI